MGPGLPSGLDPWGLGPGDFGGDRDEKDHLDDVGVT
jgi:hypothetical protein